ncbi:MAG: P-II family nitrogen regulator [Candidatus Saganbacteria bacterium]|nr:P-II family nitrogen regulator [Candidatus Saganbacteria bacterium]
MKLIEACVRTEVADKVIRALDKLRVSCVSVIDVKTIGVETAEKEKELSVEYATAYATRSKIKIFCDDKMATKIFDTIIKEAYTGHKGDGFISQTTLEKFEKIKEV